MTALKLSKILVVGDGPDILDIAVMVLEDFGEYEAAG